MQRMRQTCVEDSEIAAKNHKTRDLFVNRYRTVCRFKGHANSRARISVEK